MGFLKDVVTLGGDSANRHATNAQLKGIRAANKLQIENRDYTRKIAQPYLDAGALGQKNYLSGLGLNGPQDQEALYSQFRSAPGYQFAIDEGQRGLDHMSAAHGNFGSGNYLRDLMKFRMGMADQNFGGYMDRLNGLAGSGQETVNMLANAGQNYANQAGQNKMAAGAARASGYLGAQNSMINGLKTWGSVLTGMPPMPSFGGGQSPGLAIGQMPSHIPR